MEVSTYILFNNGDVPPSQVSIALDVVKSYHEEITRGSFKTTRGSFKTTSHREGEHLLRIQFPAMYPEFRDAALLSLKKILDMEWEEVNK